LIALGLFILLLNAVSLSGGAFLLGLGLAFLVVRVTTGNYGFSAPAGILIGLGAFVALNDAHAIPSSDGGWAVVLLGLGFLVVYLIGGRVERYWPLFPATILIGIGLMLVGRSELVPLAPYTWVAAYWPAILVVLGGWLLLRPVLPEPIRAIASGFVALLLVLAGTIAIAAVVASSVDPAAWERGRIDFGNTGAFPVVAPLSSTTTLTAPIAAGDSLRVANETGGSTWVMAGIGNEVRAQVSVQSWSGAQPNVQLTPGSGGLTLDARGVPDWLGRSPRVDLVVTAPSNAPVVIQSSSGDVLVRDRQGAVRIESSSGSVDVGQVAGAVDVRASSGGINVNDVQGELRVANSSGSIEGARLLHVRDVSTSSGSIDLSGTFSDSARVQASSGSVNLGLTPDSSVRITANTSSGNISVSGLSLTTQSQSAHHLDAVVGNGSAPLTITTSSGSVHLGSAR
jgi:hypothetical protein